MAETQAAAHARATPPSVSCVSSILERGRQVHPTAVALVDGDRYLDFRGAHAAAGAFGSRLSRAGVRPRSVVAVLARNSLEAAVAYLGTWSVGAVPAGINARLNNEEIRRELAILDSAVVVGDADLLRLVETGRATLALDDAKDTQPAGGRALDQAAGDVASIFFTSGTTADPKPVLVSHVGLLRNCNTVPPLLGLGRGDRWVLATPLCHIGGITRLLNALAAGATVDLLASWDPEAFAARTAAGGTHAMLIGPMITDVLELGAAAAQHVRRLRLAYYGAGRTDANVLEALVDRYPDLALAQGWGATETAGSVTMLTPDDHRRALAGSPELLSSAGRALPGIGLGVDLDGRITVRGDGLALGVLEEREIRPLVGDDGALLTNDLGELDAEGYLFVRGRHDDAIRSGGLTVVPARVEAALLSLPAVADAAVVGAPDSRLGERVVAFVVARGGFLDTDAIRDGLRTRLAGYEIPRRFVVTTELPLTAAGKVDRSRLRAAAAEVIVS